MSFWNMCLHEDRTPADEDGYALCSSCGARVVSHLTPTILHQAFDAMWRDHGRFGRHSKACVNSDLGWVCADDCQIVRGAA